MGSEAVPLVPEIVVPELTIDDVSQLIGKKVKSFSIKPGSAPGDNYMSVLYCLRCVLDEAESKNKDGKEDIVYAISKCFPAHPVRQQYLVKSNIFWNELSIYKDWIPELQKLVPDMSLPFPPLISGAGIDFGKGPENAKMAEKYKDTVFSPFDHHIMMVDMRHTFGFRMADRMIGLGYDEMVLVMKEYAKIHALSWVYKIKYDLKDLAEKFPVFKFEMSEEDFEVFGNMIRMMFQTTYDTLKGIIVPGEEPLLEAVHKAKESLREIMEAAFLPGASGSHLEEMLRIKPEKSEELKKEDNVPWSVVVHGDCWSNNLLFRYDPETKKAVEVVLVDLQVMREACPTSDLSYGIYASTSPEFRRKHLDEMLKLYSDEFMRHCDAFGVEYLPGFSFESLKRRFHRAKVMGFVMGCMLLPIRFKDAAEAQSLDNFKADTDLAEMMATSFGGAEGSTRYKECLYGLVKELYEEGVI